MSKNEKTTFHNEDAVFRIAMWSNIISWVALVLAVFQLANGIVELYPQWEQFLMSVPEFYKRVLILAQFLVAEPILGGVFVFLVLQGVSQGLYLLMDFYMDDEDDDYDDDDEDEVDED